MSRSVFGSGIGDRRGVDTQTTGERDDRGDKEPVGRSRDSELHLAYCGDTVDDVLLVQLVRRCDRGRAAGLPYDSILSCHCDGRYSR